MSFTALYSEEPSKLNNRQSTKSAVSSDMNPKFDYMLAKYYYVFSDEPPSRLPPKLSVDDESELISDGSLPNRDIFHLYPAELFGTEKCSTYLFKRVKICPSQSS